MNALREHESDRHGPDPGVVEARECVREGDHTAKEESNGRDEEYDHYWHRLGDE